MCAGRARSRVDTDYEQDRDVQKDTAGRLIWITRLVHLTRDMGRVNVGREQINVVWHVVLLLTQLCVTMLALRL